MVNAARKGMSYVGGSGQPIALVIGIMTGLMAAGGWPGYDMISGTWDPVPMIAWKWFGVVGGAVIAWWRGARGGGETETQEDPTGGNIPGVAEKVLGPEKDNPPK